MVDGLKAADARSVIYHPGNGGYLHAHGWSTGNVSAIFRGSLILDGTFNPLCLNSA